jgi:RNA polymerase sigma factor (sigma-70 family)
LTSCPAREVIHHMLNSLDGLAAEFEQHRARLRAVAYHMTGSLAEAEDAVQEAWLRLSRTDPAGIDNLPGWLTAVVARLCLDVLRARAVRPEDPARRRLPDPVLSGPDGVGPEQQALLADSVGLAMLVVLDTLSAAERTAFVLHDVFAVPFEDIARLAGRSTNAMKQLASRGRRRVRDGVPRPDPDPTRRRAVADAFFAAAREGDFDALLAVLDPDVVVRADLGPAQTLRTLRGAHAVAREAARFARLTQDVRPVLVNGGAGRIAIRGGAPFAVLGLTVADGRVAALDVIVGPHRLRALGISLTEVARPAGTAPLSAPGESSGGGNGRAGLR